MLTVFVAYACYFFQKLSVENGDVGFYAISEILFDRILYYAYLRVIIKYES